MNVDKTRGAEGSTDGADTLSASEQRIFMEWDFEFDEEYYARFGMLPEYVRVFEYSKVQASRGVVQAQYHLGKSYFFGMGAAKDYAAAKRWLQTAAQRGHARAKELLGRLP